MAFLTSPDGFRLYYEVEGSRGPPVVLHLGAGCDLSLWRAAGYVEALSNSYRWILFDHRGHGQSDRPRAMCRTWSRAGEFRRVEERVKVADQILRSAASWFTTTSEHAAPSER